MTLLVSSVGGLFDELSEGLLLAGELSLVLLQVIRSGGRSGLDGLEQGLHHDDARVNLGDFLGFGELGDGLLRLLHQSLTAGNQLGGGLAVRETYQILLDNVDVVNLVSNILALDQTTEVKGEGLYKDGLMFDALQQERVRHAVLIEDLAHDLKQSGGALLQRNHQLFAGTVRG
ncbi:hypothetical protein TYRP_016337 [Tyrophagus putrescentiae]|nr:hypothetical protein TYRP_016337 [Tyrophagus putrescentiae]